MRAEYDMSGGKRGKYASRFPKDVVKVTLAPDVAVAFPNAKAVNDALRQISRKNITRSIKNSDKRVREILEVITPLAAEYYRLTKKPLGVTGEIAEHVAANLLKLTLVEARKPGYDALRGKERIQIKGRAYGSDAKPGQRISRIKLDPPCDKVILVLMDNATLKVNEIWEASFEKVKENILSRKPKARSRDDLSVSAFKKIAKQIWPK
jgi:hypothetical protein